MKAHVNDIAVEYDFSGPEQGEVVVLIMGLGMQMIAWPPSLCQTLMNAGYRVLRFDNRDIGLSSHLDSVGVPNLPLAWLKSKLGLPLGAAYKLDDMAKDTVALMDHLRISSAHIVGVSMGGMIAQLVAARSPKRTRSLTSIMSTSGRRGLPGPTRAARKALMSRPPPSRNTDLLAEHSVKVFRTIGSPEPGETDAQLKARILTGIQRSYHPAGLARQLVAIAASGSRVAALKKINAPTLVIHGTVDPLVPIKCGEDTANSIKGAKMVKVAGMGHDLAPSILPAVQTHLLDFFKSLSAPV
jgi:pimeloyl-ACP methyl ester carboxylesterase